MEPTTNRETLPHYLRPRTLIPLGLTLMFLAWAIPNAIRVLIGNPDESLLFWGSLACMIGGSFLLVLGCWLVSGQNSATFDILMGCGLSGVGLLVALFVEPSISWRAALWVLGVTFLVAGVPILVTGIVRVFARIVAIKTNQSDGSQG